MSQAPARRPAGAPRAGAEPRRKAGKAALCRRDRSNARAGPRTPRRGRACRARTRAGSCRCPLRRRRGRSRRCRRASHRARARAPRARVCVRRTPRWREPPLRPVSRAQRGISTPAHEDKPASSKDKALRPMRSAFSMATIDRSIRRAEEAGDDSSRTRRAEADRADEGSRGTGRRRPAAARPRVGQAGRAADPVHPRLVAEPPLLGEAVRERAGRRVPARGLRPPRPRHVRGAARARALHRRQALGRRRGGNHRRAAVSTGRCSSAGPTAPSSSATTCARTARIGSPRSTSSRAPSSWARRRSGR